MSQEDSLAVTVALAYGPTWYTLGWWSPSSHEHDHLGHESVPWSDMPQAVVNASPDDTLAVVLDRAGEALGIEPGPDAFKHAPPGHSRMGLASMLWHIGFYRPADEDGFNIPESYRWKNCLPVADVAGNVTYHPCQQITYRQLIVSERLGVIDGDVMRPYICPSMPQGDIQGITEVARVTAEVAKLAWEGADIAVDQARQHANDIQLTALGLGAVKWASKKLRGNEEDAARENPKPKLRTAAKPKQKRKSKRKSKPKLRPKGAQPSRRRKGGKP